MSFRTGLSFLSIVLVAALTPRETGVTRRVDFTFDGKTTLVDEGVERDIECRFAPGKSHRCLVKTPPTYLYEDANWTFEFDPEMAITVSRDEDGNPFVGARSESVLFEIVRYNRKLKTEEYQAIVAEPEKSYIDDGCKVARAAQDSRKIGAIEATGIAIVGQSEAYTFEHWVGRHDTDASTCIIYMVYQSHDRLRALRHFGHIQRTFKLLTPTALPSSRSTATSQPAPKERR